VGNAPDPCCEKCAEQGAEHSGYAENQNASPLDQTSPQELQRPEECDAANNKERTGDGHFLILPEQVDEHWHGQYRATRSEQA